MMITGLSVSWENLCTAWMNSGSYREFTLPFPEGYNNETLYVKFRPGYVQQGTTAIEDKVPLS